MGATGTGRADAGAWVGATSAGATGAGATGAFGNGGLGWAATAALGAPDRRIGVYVTDPAAEEAA